MQNRYVGDVGDFANNGLLRWLTGMTAPNVPDSKRLRLGVVSYLNHDDGQYGNKVGYPELKKCDPILYETLQNLVKVGNRNLREAEYRQLMPLGTAFFDECRCIYTNRPQWLADAVAATTDENLDLVFLNPDNGIKLDPDNGIKLDSYDHKLNNDSPKHVYFSDMSPFIEAGKSLVIYHHYARGVNAKTRITTLVGDLQASLNPHGCAIYTLWFHRIQARFYFLVVQPNHQEAIIRRLRCFLESPWHNGDNPHFTLRDEEGNRLCAI